MSQKIKIHPNKFKFDAFDAGLDDTPGRDGGVGPLVEVEIKKSVEDNAQPEPDPKTAQEYVEALVRGEL